MYPVLTHRFTRRSLLQAAAASAVLTAAALSERQAVAAESGPFDFEALTTRMRESAKSSYAPASSMLPEPYSRLDYDSYRMIQFDTKKARWADAGLGYQIQAFAPGWLYNEPVGVFEVDDGAARSLDFGRTDFSYFDAALKKAAAAATFPGVPGFRVNYPLNKPAAFDELVSFLGASYFRALGRQNLYGASARGLVVNSWLEGAEEFPRFSEFYLERPQKGGPLVIYAALDSQSATGAYRFEITPGTSAAQETVMNVTARLFFRADVAELGVAPLTSMFLFADTNRADFDDYRPRVHDSDGLVVEREDGEVMWRALNNSKALGNTYVRDSNARAFGLYQRNRDFGAYQDAGAHYERRPSVRIEPVGSWGPGSVRLIEVPTKLEADDNIVAFWIPADPVKAGEAREFSYRLIWGDLNPKDDGALAHVAQTRAGQGGFAGITQQAGLRKFVIDFKGGELAVMSPEALLEVNATVSAGKITSSTLQRVAETGVWRLVLDVDTAGQKLVELKAAIATLGRPLTETWLYQWRSVA